MPKDGYNAVRWMRERAPEKRGGQDKTADGFDRGGATLAVYADQFLDWLRVHNRTPSAVLSRRGDLKPFLRWAEERGLLDPRQITRSILESYQRHVWNYRKKNDNPLGVSTQYSRLNGLKRFFSWLCRERVLDANPASELEMPRLSKRLPEDTLSVAEVEAILAVPDIVDPMGLRDRAALELFYSTGIRRSELAGLQVNDLHRDKQTLFIRQGKGRRDRVVPVGRRALAWVEKYLEAVRPLFLNHRDEPALFLTGYGEAFNADVLTRLVGGYLRKAGIGRTKGGCHLLRHACATHMLEGGADIRYIQELLGHAKLDTTAIYTRVSITQLQEVHGRCHPAEQTDRRGSSRRSSESEGGCHPAEQHETKP